jgi:uncharacterized membrane protein
MFRRLLLATTAFVVAAAIGGAVTSAPVPAAAAVPVAAQVASAGDRGCAGIAGAGCGVDAGPGGAFHGLLAVAGEPWVLETAAHVGTQPGCGDCTWEIVLACPRASPTDPGSQTGCAVAARSGGCRSGQRLYRVYLSTAVVLDQVVGTVCLGDGNEPVPVGAIAAGDVQRYLRNVRPPDQRVVTRPPHATLAGLRTFFTAHPPADLVPVRFGGPDVTETITITPRRLDWRWGDGTATGWAPDTSTRSHTYLRGGAEQGTLTTRWGADYTVSYEGETVGPLRATGSVVVQQPFRVAVGTSSPVLVSR